MSFRSFGLSPYGLPKGVQGTATDHSGQKAPRPYGLSPYGLAKNPISIVTGNIATGVAGHFSFTGKASEVSTPTTAQGVAGHLALTGNASEAGIPNIAAGVAGHLTLTGKVATAKIDNIALGVAGHLDFTGNASKTTGSNTVEGVAGHLTLTGKAAQVNTPTTSLGVAGHLSLTGKDATAKTIPYHWAQGVAGHLSLTGKTATAKIDNIAQGVSGHLSLTGNASITTQKDTALGVAGHLPFLKKFGKVDNGITVTTEIKEGPIDYTDDVLVDITPVVSEYVTTGIPIGYNVTGIYGAGSSGINGTTLNTGPINQPGVNYPGPDIQANLNFSWSQGAVLVGGMTFKYVLMDDAEYGHGELNHKYGQGTPEPVVYSSDLNMVWELDAYVATAQINELNFRLAHTGVDYYADCLSEINALRVAEDLPPLLRYSNVSGIPGSDIAWDMSHQMAKHSIFATESPSFDEGFRTLEDYSNMVPEGVWKIGALAAVWAMDSIPTPADLVAWFAAQPTSLEYMLDDYKEDNSPDPSNKYEHFWIGIEYNWENASLDGPTGNPAGTKYAYITFIFGGVLQAGADGMQEISLNNKYQMAAYSVSTLSNKYEQDAYTEVLVQHDSPYGLRVANQHEAPFGSRATQQHVAPITYRVARQLDAPYGEMVRVITQHDSKYAIQQYNFVTTDHAALWSIGNVVVQHNAPYVGLGRVQVQHLSAYTATDTVVKQHDAPYRIDDFNRVLSDLTSIWSMMSDTDYAAAPIRKLIHNGVEIEIDSLTLSSSESGVAWEFEAALVDVKDYKTITRRDTIIVQLAADQYTMVVESKELNRSDPAEVTMRLRGASPIVLKAPPHAQTITKSYTSIMSAKAIVEDLLGESVTWGIVDWFIPAYRMAVSNGSAITAAQRVVEAVGGVIESNLNGTINIRPKYPVTVPDFSTATPDMVLTDIDDNLSVSEGFHMVESYNVYRVKDGDSVYQDKLEHVPDPDNKFAPCTIRCYPTPWRTNVTLKHTWDSRISLAYVGEVTRVVEEELVEFVAGVGNLKYPATSITLVDWESLALTGLTFDPYTSKVTTSNPEDYGLAKITYQTKSIDYTATQPADTDAQFVLEDA